jgi:hypothetical protein
MLISDVFDVVYRIIDPQKRGSLEYSKERAVLIATKEEGSCDNLKQ